MATVDNSGLEALRKQLAEAVSGQEKDAFFERCCREMAARFLRKVIKRTPVGDGQFEAVRNDDGGYAKDKTGKPKLQRLTNGGTLRRGWTAGRNINPVSFAGTIRVRHMGKQYFLVIKNNTSYASYVEYGHRQEPGRFVPVLGKKLKKSWVRGQFMMTKSSKEVDGEAPAILQRRLEAFLREVFNGK